MIVVDTSVVVAAFASWHESHEPASRVVAAHPALPASCALEAYAVLTRLPPPHRAPARLVRDFLAQSFSDSPLVLPSVRSAQVVDELVERDITGGAAYDGVIALVAEHHGGTLTTLDRRARATYERVGVATRFLV
ncbi:MAG: PIN domain-containing protein [Chloroflexota bacterium]